MRDKKKCLMLLMTNPKEKKKGFKSITPYPLPPKNKPLIMYDTTHEFLGRKEKGKNKRK